MERLSGQDRTGRSHRADRPRILPLRNEAHSVGLVRQSPRARGLEAASGEVG